MKTFITLVKDTEEAKKDVKGTVKRGKKLIALAEKLGVKVKSIYWTMGQYDGMAILEAPDAETISALLLAYGGVRSETSIGFSADEMEKIISKMK